MSIERRVAKRYATKVSAKAKYVWEVSLMVTAKPKPKLEHQRQYTVQAATEKENAQQGGQPADDGRVVGIISRRDLLPHLYETTDG